MSNLGLGVMISLLGEGSQTIDAIKKALNQKISRMVCGDKSMDIVLENGDTLTLWDDGQSCCEYRYMVCDDDLSTFVGATLKDIQVVPADNLHDGYEVHEVQFLNIVTDLGVCQISNHNEHNGYYGGFAISARFTPASE